MEWKEVNSIYDLPKDRCFLVMWKGRVCLCNYDEEEGRFYIIWDPTDWPMRVEQTRESKFHFWMELPSEKYKGDFIDDLEKV
jgi:hypothetical protein